MKKTFTLRIAALAALALAAATAPASATVYDWSADISPSSGGSILGSGTITAQNTISTSYDNKYTGNLVTAITGTFDNVAITGLLGVNTLALNDNLINTSDGILDGDGISFQLASIPAKLSRKEVNFYTFSGKYFIDVGGSRSGTFTLTPASSVAVPEPSSLLLLASGALGLLLVARRRRA